MTTFAEPRANPLTLGPLATRADIQWPNSRQVFAGPEGEPEPFDPHSVPTVPLDETVPRKPSSWPPLSDLLAWLHGDEE